MAATPGSPLADETTRWWWIRHAPVTNDGGRIYGQADLACDCSDTPIFESLAHVLPENALWITSNLTRTKETAAAIMAAGGPRPEAMLEVPAFAEQNFGAWQGIDRVAFRASRAVPHGFWYCPADETPPDGESFVDMVARVRAAMTQVTRGNVGRDIVAVAHGGTIRAAMSIALDVEPEAGLVFATDNCAITRLDHLGGVERRYRWRVVCVNHRPWAGQVQAAPGVPA